MDLVARPAHLCYACLTYPVRPRDVNVYGSIFGGHVMDLVDRVATRAASAFADRPVVTASLDLITFVAGIHAFERVRVEAMGTRTWSRSMEVQVTVDGQDPLTGRTWRTSDACLTVVALDETGRPVPLPTLVPTTPEEKARWELAGQRRELRLRRPPEPEPDFYAAGPATARNLSFESVTEQILPAAVNEAGFCRAGYLLARADSLAALVAARHAHLPCVTAAVDSVSFRRPIAMGEVVTVKAYGTRAFRTSLEVRVEIWKRGPYGGEVEHVTTAYFTFVALGEGGRPAPVPPIVPQGAWQEALFASALERRALRLQAVEALRRGSAAQEPGARQENSGPARGDHHG